MMDKKQKESLNKLSFEDAIKELTSIVSQIEQGEIPLQESLERYEKGMSLIKHCRGILQKAEKRIEKISEAESDDKKEKKSEKNGNAEEDELF